MEGGFYAIVSSKNKDSIEFKTLPYYVRTESISHNCEVKNYKEAISQTRLLFDAAVEKRLVSDVDFGAFLSGGVDSSAVVAVMSKYLQTPVKTFHVYFDE